MGLLNYMQRDLLGSRTSTLTMTLITREGTELLSDFINHHCLRELKQSGPEEDIEYVTLSGIALDKYWAQS